MKIHKTDKFLWNAILFSENRVTPHTRWKFACLKIEAAIDNDI